jgi:hypothetical protein
LASIGRPARVEPASLLVGLNSGSEVDAGARDASSSEPNAGGMKKDQSHDPLVHLR